MAKAIYDLAHTHTRCPSTQATVGTRADAQASQRHRSAAQHCNASKRTATAAAGDASQTPVNRKGCAGCVSFDCTGVRGHALANIASGLGLKHNTQHIKRSLNSHTQRCGAKRRPTWLVGHSTHTHTHAHKGAGPDTGQHGRWVTQLTHIE
jgi:hypothetical protein